MKVYSSLVAALFLLAGLNCVSVSEALHLRNDPTHAPAAPAHHEAVAHPSAAPSAAPAEPAAAAPSDAPVASSDAVAPAPAEPNPADAAPDLSGVNFNKIAPFGKENTAKELQDHASKTQDTLVDAVEEAEVAEIKRAVFRALTRLRAATIKEFDTIARLQTQSIDSYNDAHHYRNENPISHLHEDEAPVETDKLQSFH